MSWAPNKQYKIIQEANRQYYAKTAKQYDSTETCVVSGKLQGMLEEDLNWILKAISKNNNNNIRVLDACGGSGNISLKLLSKNIDVTLCDLSPDLLEIYKSKCENLGYTGKVVCQEIGAFLSSNEEKFDLITFSSALHHIEDYSSILKLAINRLNKNGYIYTVFDPIKWKFPSWEILFMDYVLFKFLKHPFDVIPALKRRVTRIISRGKNKKTVQQNLINDSNVGTLAEYHVKKGIDDLQLVEMAKENGMNVIWHNRYHEARYPLFQWLLKVFGCKTTFKLLLQKR